MNKIILFLFILLLSIGLFDIVEAPTVPIYYVIVTVQSEDPLVLNLNFETPTTKVTYSMTKEITLEEINTFIAEKGINTEEGRNIEYFLNQYANNLYREISQKKAKIEGALKYSHTKGEDTYHYFKLISGNFSYPRLTIPYIGLAGYFFKSSEEDFLMSSAKINGKEKYVFIDFDGTFGINTLLSSPIGTPAGEKNYIIIEPLNEMFLYYDKNLSSFTIKECEGDPCMTIVYAPTRIFYEDFRITPESLKDLQENYDKVKYRKRGSWGPAKVFSFSKDVILKKKDNYCIFRGTFSLQEVYTKETGAFSAMNYEIEKGGYNFCKHEVVGTSPTKTSAVFGMQKDSYFTLNLENDKIFANLRNSQDINTEKVDFNYNDFSVKSLEQGTVASLHETKIIFPNQKYIKSLISVYNPISQVS